MNTQRRLRPAEAIYQPEPAAQAERLPPVLVWLPEGERPLHDVEDTLKYHLQLQLPRSTYETWVRDMQLIALTDEHAIIQPANRYAQEWLDLRLKPLIARTLARIIGRPVQITITAPCQ